MRTLTTTLAAGFAAAVVSLANPAAAATIATFGQVDSTNGLVWHRTADTGTGKVDGTLFTKANGVGGSLPGTAGTINTVFSFTGLGSTYTGLSATFFLYAVESGHTAVYDPISNQVTEAFLNGETGTQGFKFVYTGPNIAGINTGDVLLGGTFHNAMITGQKGGTQGSFSGPVTFDPTASVTFFSDFLDTSHFVNQGFSLGLTSVNSHLGANNATGSNSTVDATKALRSFSASVAGTFSADVLAVPEPGTWALMIGGFGMAGVMLRRRRGIATA